MAKDPGPQGFKHKYIQLFETQIQMAYYRVQVTGNISGNHLERLDDIYTFEGIKAVQTLDKDCKENVIYRTKGQFRYSMYLNQPSVVQIIEAKKAIQQRMVQDLQEVIDDLYQLKQTIQNLQFLQN